MWSIDPFATALDAAGLPMPQDKPLDGNKYFRPQSKARPLNFTMNSYWSSAGDKGKWAICSGDWKLVAEKNRIELFNLQKDLGETTNLAAKHPQIVSELTDKYNTWLDEMADPVSNQEKRWNPDAGAPAKKMSKEEKKAAREKRKTEKVTEGT